MDLSGQRVNAISSAEDVVGTNAISLALMSNKPESVFRYEHFISLAHVYYCLAVPFHNRKGEIVGVILIVCQEINQLNFAAFNIAICCAQICTALCSYLDNENEFIIDNKKLNKIIQNIPQGLVHVDHKNVIKYYNQRVLEILNISHQKKVLQNYISTFSNYEGYKNADVIMDKSSSPTPFFVTTKEIEGKSKDQKDRLIIIDHSERILKLKQFITKTRETIDTDTFDKIIGKDKNLLMAKQIALQSAKTSYPVLIYGESGTGKELFAQAIHNASLRSNHPFVPVNCGAIPSELVESVLFGYEPGAFTGALKNGKKGFLEAASGGTLFMDEIESMPMHVQVALLRALSERKIQTVGGTKEKLIDVRIISASKKNLLEESDVGRFREDLFYRLSTITINLPPLRERSDDISLLAQHFIDKINSQIDSHQITAKEDYLNALRYHYWRGNIRELENVIARSILSMGEGEKELNFKHLPEIIQKAYIYKRTRDRLLTSEIVKKDARNILSIGEEILIETTLMHFHYNMKETTLALGISRKTLYNKIHSNEKLYKKIKDRIEDS